MVYYGNPNLNKPLHVGHMRNLCIGETISRMLEAVGAEVIRGSIESDCGIHIAKTVFAKNHLASSAQESPAKGDHGAGQYYRLFEEALEQETTGRTSTVSDQEKSSLLEACEEMTVRWLRGDPETREAFRTITDAVAQGHRQTLDQVGVQFDRRFLESAAVNRIHEMVEKGLSLGVFRKNSQGAIVADLKAFNNTEPMIVRPNGIPVHLGIIAAHNAVVAEEYALHGTIGLEGSEFGDFLQVLTWVIGLLGYQPMDGSVLVNYGMVTRGGEDVSSSKADAPLIDDVLQRIGKELSSRLPGREAHLALGPNGATRLALANLKFFLLLIALHRNMAYDEKRLLQIRGKCGVSLLRGAARLSEFEECPGACAGAGLNLTRSQRILLLDMFRSPLALDEAITKIQPHRLAQSAYDLVRHAEVALDEGDRLADKNKALVRTMFAACLVILRRYLWLLNIAEVDSALSEVDSS
ncbi:MAG: arginine--tRNA ligase [Dehalococcoidia bacterium]|nr:arginine--tRNA ligase [Dehalococcoidia bacterium]